MSTVYFESFVFCFHTRAQVCSLNPEEKQKLIIVHKIFAHATVDMQVYVSKIIC